MRESVHALGRSNHTTPREQMGFPRFVSPWTNLCERMREKEKERVCVRKTWEAARSSVGHPLFSNAPEKKKEKSVSRAIILRLRLFSASNFPKPCMSRWTHVTGWLAWYYAARRSSNWYFFFPYSDVNEFICVGSSWCVSRRKSRCIDLLRCLMLLYVVFIRVYLCEYHAH